jgi:hypothetical protein
MTLTEMRTAVRNRMGNPSTDGFYTDAQLTDLINEAMHFVSAMDDWPWLQTSETITTTAGDGSYAPNANWVRTKQLFIQESEPFVLISLAEVDDYGLRQGQPDTYHIYAEELLLRPVPSGAFSVIHQYIRKETTLSADGDTPVMPSMFHYAIVEYATYLGHARAGYAERSQLAFKGFQDWYKNMVSFRRRSQLPVRPRVRPGSWL